MGRRLDGERGRLLVVVLQHDPTPDGGTHENGLRIALLRGIARARRAGRQQKRMQAVSTDDVMATCAAMLSVFIREPEFQGQTKDKLATVEAGRIVENSVRDAFDHWLAAFRCKPTSCSIG